MYNIFVYYKLYNNFSDCEEYVEGINNGIATIDKKISCLEDIFIIEREMLLQANIKDKKYTHCKLVNFVYL